MKAVELCQLSGAGGGGDTWHGLHGATKFGGNIANSCKQSVSVSGRNVSGKIHR